MIENGKILQKNLQKTRVTMDELVGHLREKDVIDLSAVQFAILETNGNLSVFPYPKERPATAAEAGIEAKKQFLPITIIEDGYVSKDNLRKAGKDAAWLDRVLTQRKTSRKETLLLTVDKSDHIMWIPRGDGE